MKTMSANELKSRLDEQGEDLRVINVLPARSFREKRIPGSENVPLSEGEDFVMNVQRLVGDKDAPVVVYCASTSCNASPRAARELEAAGFRNVYDFEGGVAEWEREGFPLEGSAA